MKPALYFPTLTQHDGCSFIITESPPRFLYSPRRMPFETLPKSIAVFRLNNGQFEYSGEWIIKKWNVERLWL